MVVAYKKSFKIRIFSTIDFVTEVLNKIMKIQANNLEKQNKIANSYSLARINTSAYLS